MLARTTTPEINKENPKWISRVTKIRSTWQINYPKDRVSLSVRFTHTLTSMVKPFLRKDSRASALVEGNVVERRQIPCTKTNSPPPKKIRLNDSVLQDSRRAPTLQKQKERMDPVPAIAYVRQ